MTHTAGFLGIIITDMQVNRRKRNIGRLSLVSKYRETDSGVKSVGSKQ